MTDGTENQAPYNTDAIMGDIRRTEAERVRMAEVAAHERRVVSDLEPRGAALCFANFCFSMSTGVLRGA